MGKPPKPNPTPIPNPKPGSVVPHADRKKKALVICGAGSCNSLDTDLVAGTIDCDVIDDCDWHDQTDICECELFRATRMPPGEWKHVSRKGHKNWNPKKYYYWCFCARMVDKPKSSTRTRARSAK